MAAVNVVTVEAFPAIVGQGSIEKVQSGVCTTPTPSGGTPFLPKVRGGFHISMKEEEEEMERKRKMRKRKKKMFKFRHKDLGKRLDSQKDDVQVFTNPADRHMTVEKMWNELKIDAMRKLRPIILHSHKLNELASPSARQCLEIYKKPTAIDKFTGKPIPLGQVLEEVTKRTSMCTLSILNAAMSQVVRHSQMRAEIMLQRKDPYNSRLPEIRQDWYFPKMLNAIPSADSRTTERKQKQIKRKRINSSQLKKHLPLYLTVSGSVVSASLEKFGSEILYCTPSRKFHDEEEPESEISESVFLTNVSCKSPRPSPGPSLSATVEVSATKSILKAPTQTTTSSESVWQPLTTSALVEQTSVSQMPVKGLGHLAHGHYQMWRPASSTEK